MVFVDQLKRSIEVNFPPKRIVSLVPSQSELLFDLGLREEVIGITKFCIHPDEWCKTKVRVGGTKKPDFNKIYRLKPDLIIANKEENEKLQIEELAKTIPVWISNVRTVEGAAEMINSIGEITGRPMEAKLISTQIIKEFENLKLKIKSLNFCGKRVAYFIWKKPLIVAGRDTFINEMLERCGMKNIFLNSGKRYPEISINELREGNPEIILLSSEPYPFRERHIAEFGGFCPLAKVWLVDGEMFSWYGSRLKKSVPYFLKLGS